MVMDCKTCGFKDCSIKVLGKPGCLARTEHTQASVMSKRGNAKAARNLPRAGQQTEKAVQETTEKRDWTPSEKLIAILQVLGFTAEIVSEKTDITLHRARKLFTTGGGLALFPRLSINEFIILCELLGIYLGKC